MRITSVVTVISGIFAFVFTLSATSQPADAGTVCKKLKLSSPCVSSSDMKPGINLGLSGNDGDLRVKTSGGAKGVKLDGDSGNVTSIFLNSASKSVGLVQAWAMIRTDGTVKSCLRCNKSTNQTRRLGLGRYEVDFTPLGTSITNRPRSATNDDHGTGAPAATTIGLADRSGDPSSVFVITVDNSTNNRRDQEFILIIY